MSSLTKLTLHFWILIRSGIIPVIRIYFCFAKNLSPMKRNVQSKVVFSMYLLYWSSKRLHFSWLSEIQLCVTTCTIWNNLRITIYLKISENSSKNRNIRTHKYHEVTHSMMCTMSLIMSKKEHWEDIFILITPNSFY